MSARSESIDVREMILEDVNIRIDYFHGSSDDHLRMLGVDRALLLTPAQWRDFYEQDYAKPIEQRVNDSLLWLLEDEVIGFATTDHIDFGIEAFMHLHITQPHLRSDGLGARFIVRSAAIFFDVLHLKRLLCEPNALNAAPNRTVQAAGFRYLFSHHTQPSPINYPQITTRWILDERPS